MKSAAPAGRAYPAAQAYPAAPPLAEAAPVEAPSTEHHVDYGVNPFVDANKDRLSTFSIDVDTASYSFARRKIVQENVLPPVASVRAEEFLNSFVYGYATP